MKTFLPIFTFITCLFLSGNSINQTSAQTCLEQYKNVFEKRGADHVEDGMHRNVIIALEETGETICLLGKARVDGGRVTAVWIEFEDNSYDLLEAFDFTSAGASIKNGVSSPWIKKADNRKISVIFKESIKPKKKKYKSAPKLNPNDI